MDEENSTLVQFLDLFQSFFEKIPGGIFWWGGKAKPC